MVSNNPSDDSVVLLYQACDRDDATLLAQILKNNNDLTPLLKQDDNPLFCAVETNSRECVRLLLAAGANPNGGNCTGKPVLSYAKSVEMVELLINAGANLSGVEASASTDLNIRRKRKTTNNNDILADFLEQSGDVAVSERFKIVRMLLDAGADINWRDRKFGSSRLHNMALRGDSDAVEILLNAGADPHITSYDGSTPLHDACWSGGCQYIEETNPRVVRIIELLIQAGIDVNVKNNFGITPLHKAAAGDGADQTAIRTLLKYGADPNAVTADGETALMLALRYFPELHSVRALLAAGADPAIANNKGETALLHAKQCYEFCLWRVEREETVEQDDLQALEMVNECITAIST